MGKVAISASAVSVALTVGLMTSPVHADGFATAVELESVDRLGALLWSSVARCDQQDDFERRQCEGIRDARREQVRTHTYVVPAPDALTVSPYDPKVMSVEMQITECISCKGVDIDGETYVLSGASSLRPSETGPKGKVLASETKTFKSRAEGEGWSKRFAPSLGVDLLVAIPERKMDVSGVKNQGLSLKILGHRLVNRCTGTVLSAKPRSEAVAADPSACPGAAGAAETDAPERKAKGPRKTPARQDIIEAMKPAKDKVQACFAKFKTGGRVQLKLHIEPDGSVSVARALGTFEATPTGTCIENVGKDLVFPASELGTKINVPFVSK